MEEVKSNNKKFVKYSSYEILKDESMKLSMRVHSLEVELALRNKSISKLEREIKRLRYQIKLKDYTPNTKSYEITTISDLKLAKEFVESFYDPNFNIEIQEVDDNYKLIKTKKNE